MSVFTMDMARVPRGEQSVQGLARRNDILGALLGGDDYDDGGAMPGAIAPVQAGTFRPPAESFSPLLLQIMNRMPETPSSPWQRILGR